jgi:glucokinase
MIEGEYISALNLGWHRFPLAQELRKQIDLPIIVERSARNYVLAERSFGAAKNSNNFIYVIYQAGVGLGIFVDGKPYHGSGGLEGELGHITIDPSADEICICGKRGCLEAITSAPSVVRQYVAKKGLIETPGSETTILDVFNAARQGDEIALRVLNRVVTFLGLALSFTVNVFNPEMIILGGDIPLGQDLLVSRLKEEILRNVPEPYQRSLKVQVSPLGLDIGVKGAASLAFHRTISDSASLQKLCVPPAAQMYVAMPQSDAR